MKENRNFGKSEENESLQTYQSFYGVIHVAKIENKKSSQTGVILAL